MTIDNLTNSANLTVTLSGYTTGDYAVLKYSYGGSETIVQEYGLVSSVDGGAKTYTFPHVGEGDYTISAWASDVAGNLTNNTDLVVTVDVTPPDASLITLDLDSDSDSGGDPTDNSDPLTIDNITNFTTPKITLTGVSTADSVIVYNDDINGSKKARGLPSGAVITLTQDFTDAADAEITLYATLKDAAGNESNASPNPLKINLDTTAPLSGLTPVIPDLTDATDTGEFPSDNKTYNQNPSFYLTLTDQSEADSVILYASTGIIKTTVGRTVKVLNEEFATISVGEGGVAAGTKLIEASDYQRIS